MNGELHQQVPSSIYYLDQTAAFLGDVQIVASPPSQKICNNVDGSTHLTLLQYMHSLPSTLIFLQSLPLTIVSQCTICSQYYKVCER